VPSGVAAVSALCFCDLTDSRADRALLRRFYDDVYTPEFPDPDEKESLANIERHLELKAEGWYGDNAYHVVVVESGGAIVAGAIADYLVEPNAGAMEFLVVTPSSRGQGLGRRLLDWTEALIAADAQRAGRPGPDFIVAEINDPFRVDLAADNLDPFLRARVWGGWGYRKLDFPYVQPALSEAQRPVHHLMLAVKPLADAYAGRASA
jgi:GNAT superfamily N-acetyltransferase